MSDVTHAQAIVAFAGFGMGGTLGGFLGTQTELQKRGLDTKQHNFVPPLPNRGFLYGLSSGLVVALIAFAVAFGVLEIGGVRGVSAPLRLPFFIGLVIGAGVAKTLRYLYWRSR